MADFKGNFTMDDVHIPFFIWVRKVDRKRFSFPRNSFDLCFFFNVGGQLAERQVLGATVGSHLREKCGQIWHMSQKRFGQLLAGQCRSSVLCQGTDGLASFSSQDLRNSEDALKECRGL